MGQAVTAKTKRSASAAGASAACSADSSASSASLSASNLSIILKNSLGLLAAYRAVVNSSSISRVLKRLNTSRCTLSSVSGAAIIKNSLAGWSSKLAKSTPSLTIIAASPGALTALVLAWGMAIPSPIPVLPSSSRASTQRLYSASSASLPLLAIKVTKCSSASALEPTFACKSILSLASKSAIFIYLITPFLCYSHQFAQELFYILFAGQPFLKSRSTACTNAPTQSLLIILSSHIAR